MPTTPEERYQINPLFHALVDMLISSIQEAQFTPTELREAATLACTMYEMVHIRRVFPSPSDDALLRRLDALDIAERSKIISPNERRTERLKAINKKRAELGLPTVDKEETIS